MRGERQLQEIFPKLKKQSNRIENTQKRVWLMVNRYYYYYHLCNYRNDVAVCRLEQEFFLSQETIMQNLTAHSELLKKVIQSAPDRVKLKKQFPHLNWS